MTLESKPRPVDSLRYATATLNRALVLGFGAAVLSSILQWAITINLVGPLVGPGGLGLSSGPLSQLILALYQQAALLLVLPGLAWCAGWLFEGRGRSLGIAAALVVQLLMLAMAYLGDGTHAFVEAPIYHVSRVVLAVGIGVLAGFSFEDAHRRLDAMSKKKRRVAPTAARPAPSDGQAQAAEPSPEK